MKTVILPLHARPAVRVSMQLPEAQCVWNVRLVHMMTTRTLRLAALAALQDTSLQQLALQAVPSVEQASMTMTLILLLHARAAVRVSTLQRARRHAVIVRLGT